jgi:BirA family transcriptional regulator, biotin operon repressor / biotin---[acetyl-CoA-carboxylase] ligase
VGSHNLTRRMVGAMWAGEWQIRRFGEIGSTNSYLLERARQGDPEGLVAVADHQTAGRGRLDRRWESPPGANLLASVLLRPDCRADDLHLCTGALGLAALDACAEAAGVQAQLKWPNDLLVGTAKLAGILAEAEFSAHPPAVVAGIGLNVAWPGPAEAGGTCLDDLCDRGKPLDRNVLLEHMLAALGRRRPLLDHASGRRQLADEVQARCATLGQEVLVVLASEEFSGRAVAIDEAGRLLVNTGVGQRAVTAGDVIHLRPS